MCIRDSFLLTNRRGKQFNSMVFAKEDTLQGGIGRHDVFIHADDAAAFGIKNGEPFRMHNAYGEMRAIARFENIAQGHLQAYWPEANHLVPRCYDPQSREPDYNTQVRIEAL